MHYRWRCCRELRFPTACAHSRLQRAEALSDLREAVAGFRYCDLHLCLVLAVTSLGEIDDDLVVASRDCFFDERPLTGAVGFAIDFPARLHERAAR